MILKSFAKYTSLSVLGMLGLCFYILADTFFVAQGLGTNGLTALNLAVPFYSIMGASAVMIAIGAGNHYSVCRGRGDLNEAANIFARAIKLGLMFSLIFAICGFLGAGPLMGLYTSDPDIWGMSTLYLRMMFVFSPAFIMNNIFMCFVRNNGAPTLAMIAMMVGCLANTILDWIFIFPLKMGMLGAISATILAPILGICVSSIYLFKVKHFSLKVNHSKNKFHEDAAIMLRNGFPSFITDCSAGIVIMMFNGMIMRLVGEIGVAAYGVIENVYLVVIAIFNGISQGTQPLLSYEYGQGNRRNIYKIFKYAVTTILVVSIIIYALTIHYASEITTAFNSEQDPYLQLLASAGIPIYFLAVPFTGFNLFTAIYLITNNRAKYAKWISLLRGFILITPLLFVMAYLFSLNGVWFTPALTECLVSLVGIYFVIQHRHNHPI